MGILQRWFGGTKGPVTVASTAPPAVGDRLRHRGALYTIDQLGGESYVAHRVGARRPVVLEGNLADLRPAEGGGWYVQGRA